MVLHSQFDDSIEVEVITQIVLKRFGLDSAGDRISKVYKSPDDEDDDEYASGTSTLTLY